ncbi:MAG: glucoamylase family protein [Sediminibacterium sp.]|nr:glucoamylase family protein [Sediminibacterium sp.]
MNVCFIIYSFVLAACSKKEAGSVVNSIPNGSSFNVLYTKVNGINIEGSNNYNYPVNSNIKISFNDKIDKSTVTAINLSMNGGSAVSISYTYENNDSTVVVVPNAPLKYLSKYLIYIDNSVKSIAKAVLVNPVNAVFATQIDSSNKFPLLSDNALLDTIQKRTFNYFWEFAHPVSGLARERNTSGDIVTSGGSGFGIMAIPVAINRNFITRAEGLARMQKIVTFLKNVAVKFHGVFPHWINGKTGTPIAFSPKDNGADLVETSFLMAGLLTARQYFDRNINEEINLRTDINLLWNAVEWNWFRQSNQDVLYWHWSPNFNWEMNHKIDGWNECLITYLLAASSNIDSIPSVVYHKGFAKSGAIVTGNTYFNFQLPMGPSYGGPLFWSHYSFLGINPNGLKDRYADYQQQVVNHTKINYTYCIQNPKNFFGYSSSCWGLTASDIPNGYAANDPANDIGVISPTAALSSFPYTPAESMQALKFFYYKLGDKIWTENGFMDAFSLKEGWYSGTTLAIDQGPIIIMIENYRTQLIWNLLTSCPEVKRGMNNLGFTAPYL